MRLSIELPKGYMNVAVTECNNLVADTNDSQNWDTLKFPLPSGTWSLFSIKGKEVILHRKEIEQFDVIHIAGQTRAWVVLQVSQQALDYGINSDEVGLHAFGGMWYGDDPTDRASFGKILPISDLEENEYTILGVISDYDLKKLKEMLD